MSDALTLALVFSAGLSIYFSAMAETYAEEENRINFFISTLCWWSFSFFWLIALTDYWWLFILPHAIGWVYLLRLVLKIFDINKLENAILRLYG